jgi:hypothetical protein
MPFPVLPLFQRPYGRCDTAQCPVKARCGWSESQRLGPYVGSLSQPLVELIDKVDGQAGIARPISAPITEYTRDYQGNRRLENIAGHQTATSRSGSPDRSHKPPIRYRRSRAGASSRARAGKTGLRRDCCSCPARCSPFSCSRRWR